LSVEFNHKDAVHRTSLLRDETDFGDSIATSHQATDKRTESPRPMNRNAPMTTTAIPEQGQLVSVRSRPWVVNDVKPSSLPTPAMKLPVAERQHLLTLSSVEDDGLGEELQVVWEIEPGAKIVEKVALPEPSGFDAPEKLDAFLDAVR
jgi:hypothetical protein